MDFLSLKHSTQTNALCCTNRSLGSNGRRNDRPVPIHFQTDCDRFSGIRGRCPVYAGSAKPTERDSIMKGFISGIAVAILIMAAFPSLGRWVTTIPYRTFATFSPAAGSVPAAWQGGGGRGGRAAGGCPRAISAGYSD
jgi:hypothetical protein